VTGEAQVINNGNPSRSFSTSCTSGKAVGGGWSSSDLTVRFDVDISAPSADGSAWTLTVTRTAGNTSTITPYAVCITAG
jgi:hypothetical protein